jgi:hypothetical protein
MPRVAGILKRAKEVASYDADGNRESAEYFIRGQSVGRRWWYQNGQLEAESSSRDGRLHGIHREWHDNGQLLSQTQYKNGYEHGQALQWGRRGRLLGGYSMKMGTGVDLWWTPIIGRFPDEERHMKGGLRHGFERWWSKKKGVWEESHWSDGKEHGIRRRWTGRKLHRGFPQFHINDEKVTKREYLRAARTDPTLPPYDPEDDSPRRIPLTPTRPSPAACASDRETHRTLRAH